MRQRTTAVRDRCAGGGSLDFQEFMNLYGLEERLIKIINSDAVELVESKRLNLAVRCQSPHEF